MTKVIEVNSIYGMYKVLIDKNIELPSTIFANSWTNNKTKPYFAMKIGGKVVGLHRFIMKARDGDIIDHVSGDTCDNRKDNLRFVTHKQNCANKESKGYYFNKPTGKWLAQIQIDGKRKSLGRYTTPEEAQQVYRKAHAEAFGEFSPYYEYYSGITKEVN
ncbi:HNH endonuclease [Bacillus cereus]|uniref:HNH endonuclease n=2 Tax=Bacillus TaxID=1386 RepID=UPI00119CCD45|nr:HNH endonuclease [Bacillus cereus]